MSVDQLFKSLGARFEAEGHELFLVGGSVRDILLGREPKDWDFTTTALPDQVKDILRPSKGGWADTVWAVGERFGTIAAMKDGVEVEITTMRTDGPGRKPEVVFTTDLEEDLSRRDFTINAMAIRCDSDGLPDVSVSRSEVIDPFSGLIDLFLGLLKTPLEPWKTFTEDPLRMLRIARFASQLGFKWGDTEWLAMRSHAELIKAVSAERVAAELDKLITGRRPDLGLGLLDQTGLLAIVAPELKWNAVRVDTDDLEVRWASAFDGKGGHWVTQRFRALKMSNDRIRRVSRLASMAVEWEYSIDWSDHSNVRRVLAEAAKADPVDAEGFLGKFLLLLNDPEATKHIADVLSREGFPKKPLSGKEIMAHLQVGPSKTVGHAASWLWIKVLDGGPVAKDRARELLDEWKALVSL